MTGVPGAASAEELSALPAGELAVRLAEAYRLIAELTAQAGRLAAQVERLSARVEELERQARKDSLLTEQESAFPQLEGLAVAWGCTVTARG